MYLFNNDHLKVIDKASVHYNIGLRHYTAPRCSVN